jgi:hypothetical protein
MITTTTKEAPMGTTTVDRKARELRDDVLGAISRFVERRPDVDWPRILEGLWEATAIVEAAAETQLYGTAKAGAVGSELLLRTPVAEPIGTEARA